MQCLLQGSTHLALHDARSAGLTRWLFAGCGVNPYNTHIPERRDAAQALQSGVQIARVAQVRKSTPYRLVTLPSCRKIKHLQKKVDARTRLAHQSEQYNAVLMLISQVMVQWQSCEQFSYYCFRLSRSLTQLRHAQLPAWVWPSNPQTPELTCSEHSSWSSPCFFSLAVCIVPSPCGSDLSKLKNNFVHS